MYTDATDISSFESTFTREAAVDSIAEKPKKHGSGGGGRFSHVRNGTCV